jgi:peptidoglycan/xylan/chitin deacetylase (PgdA/CDA1 family)
MRGTLADMAFDLGLFQFAAFFSRGRGTLLMLHEIHSDGTLARYDGTTIAELDRMLAALRRWDIDLIAMDDLLPRLKSDNPRQFAVLTFDDGYRDNLTNALPVLERYQAPALINVPTEAVTREMLCWWLALRELFMTRDRLQIGPLGRPLDIRSPEAKIAEYRRTQRWFAADFSRAYELRPWFEDQGISFPTLCARFFMNETELQQCAAHPLITIGGHATTHRPLASLPEAEMRWELSDNKAFLENLLQIPVDHMAYPYGGRNQCGPREAAAARDSGFRTAIAVRHGKLTTETADDPYLIPREDVGYHGMRDRQLYGIVNGLYGLRAGLAAARTRPSEA